MDSKLLGIVETTVLAEMQSKASFTALDISNRLKTDRYLVSHAQVAEAVRDIYASGAMDFYAYRRRLVDVTTNAGTLKTQAFLYLHDSRRAQDYTSRAQSALPAVPPSQALPLPSRAAVRLAQPTHRASAARPARLRQKARRDGALAVSRNFVRQMNWQSGDLLGLSVQNGEVIVGPVYDPAQLLVRVWAGNRLRISRRRLATLHLAAPQVTITLRANGLHLT